MTDPVSLTYDEIQALVPYLIGLPLEQQLRFLGVAELIKGGMTPRDAVIQVCIATGIDKAVAYEAADRAQELRQH